MCTLKINRRMKKAELKNDNEDWKKMIGDTFKVRVTPKSSFNRIKAELSDTGLRLKAYVTAAPEDDKANRAVLELFAKELNVARTSLAIISGKHSREKVIQRNV